MNQSSPPKKRSLTLRGHATSVSLEDEFWKAFQEIAAKQGVSVNGLSAQIDEGRGLDQGLASAIRLYVLQDLQQQVSALDSGALR